MHEEYEEYASCLLCIGQLLRMHAPHLAPHVCICHVTPVMLHQDPECSRSAWTGPAHLEAGDDAGDGVGEVGVSEAEAYAIDEHHCPSHEPGDAHHVQDTIQAV